NEDRQIAVFGSGPFHSRVDMVNRKWPSPWSLLHYPSVTIHISRHLRSSLLGPPLHRPLARDERQ
ncbi:putative cytochrome P450 312a1, partial [Dissostichus eleginoides]